MVDITDGIRFHVGMLLLDSNELGECGKQTFHPQTIHLDILSAHIGLALTITHRSRKDNLRDKRLTKQIIKTEGKKKCMRRGIHQTYTADAIIRISRVFYNNHGIYLDFVDVLKDVFRPNAR